MTKRLLGSFLPTLDLPQYVALSAGRALQGQTPTPLRAYSFSCDDVDWRITFKAEVDRLLTESEREDLDVIETEVYADFPPGLLIETLVEVVPSSQPLHPLAGGIVFNRAGEAAQAAE